jgi:hypothetical protein
VPRSANSATTAHNVRSGFSAIRASSHSRSRCSSCRHPPICLTAVLPLARQRCDRFTTLATLSRNSAAVARQVRPLATELTTQSRKPFE